MRKDAAARRVCAAAGVTFLDPTPMLRQLRATGLQFDTTHIGAQGLYLVDADRTGGVQYSTAASPFSLQQVLGELCAP